MNTITRFYTLKLNKFIRPGDSLIITDHKGTPLQRDVIKIYFYEDHVDIEAIVVPKEEYANSSTR